MTYIIDLSEEDLYQNLANEIASEIDKEFIISLLEADGWFKQIVNPVIPLDELLKWVSDNVIYNYKQLGNVWLFININDFVAFTLRFS